MKKCMVVFAAHTAEAELGAGGTIAKFARNGYRTVLVIVTTGAGLPVAGPLPDGRDPDTLTACELAGLREAEAAAAAAVLGCELEFLRLNERFFIERGTRHYVDFRPDPPPAELPGTGWFGSIWQNEFREKATQILLREEPEFILSPPMAAACYEQKMTANNLALAYRAIPGRDGGRIGKLFAWEADQRSRTFEAPVCGIEDITAWRAVKHEALSKHPSRVDQATLDAAAARETHWGRVLGRIVRTEPGDAFAEAFARLCMSADLACA
ncbi:MAG: PIG-L family deacetylase [Kiritimatiellae bacterium]|nr:PIG-L family deacetylase [Kiritimatiellia bacterium]